MHPALFTLQPFQNPPPHPAPPAPAARRRAQRWCRNCSKERRRRKRRRGKRKERLISAPVRYFVPCVFDGSSKRPRADRCKRGERDIKRLGRHSLSSDERKEFYPSSGGAVFQTLRFARRPSWRGFGGSSGRQIPSFVAAANCVALPAGTADRGEGRGCCRI